MNLMQVMRRKRIAHIVFSAMFQLKRAADKHAGTLGCQQQNTYITHLHTYMCMVLKLGTYVGISMEMKDAAEITE
jgi:hypothetical protein